MLQQVRCAQLIISTVVSNSLNNQDDNRLEEQTYSSHHQRDHALVYRINISNPREENLLKVEHNEVGTDPYSKEQQEQKYQFVYSRPK